jgi:hypothetical protein
MIPLCLCQARSLHSDIRVKVHNTYRGGGGIGVGKGKHVDFHLEPRGYHLKFEIT